MKTSFLSTIISLFATNLFGQLDSYKLPKEWDTTFVISVSHTGSMSGGSSHLTFTYDSCKYISASGQAKPTEKVFALSQKDRDMILSKMRELKINLVNEESVRTIAAQYDGWSNMLCLGSHCIEGGSASRMSQKDKDTFQEACRFLEHFMLSR